MPSRGPGISKGMMVVHGALHEEPRARYPSTVGELARYVAARGVVVRAMAFHPLYHHDTHDNDIAVFFLNKPIESAEPVVLPVPIGEGLLTHYCLTATIVTVLSRFRFQKKKPIKKPITA